MKGSEYNFSTIFKFSIRILLREWPKFVLPFLSLTLTTLIVCTILLFTTSSSNFLLDKNKELIGGDISIESNYEVKPQVLQEVIGTDVKISASSSQYEFGGIISKQNTNTAVSIHVVDATFPLYGGLELKEGTYAFPNKNEIYIDTKTAKKLNVVVGEEIVYANMHYTVVGIVEKNSKLLLSGVSFLPTVFISTQGFERSAVDKTLLRAKFNYFYLLSDTHTAKLQAILERSKALGVKIEIAGVTQPSFIEGLAIVNQFLVLAVLLSCVLAAVNIYAGMLYVLTIMRKSFSVLLALGFTKWKLGTTLLLSLSYIIISALIIGGAVSLLLFNFIQNYIFNTFALNLPVVHLLLPALFTLLIVISISFASFIPGLRILMRLNPKILLAGGEEKEEKKIVANFFIVALTTGIPLGFVAIFLFNSLKYGLYSMGIIAAVYAVSAILFYFILAALYKNRGKFNFLIRTLIAQKYKDGLFGIVSLTSLFVALTSLALLVLLQSTLVNFIQRDLGQSIPSVYVIDIQKSQTEKIRNNFTEITLFPNVGARILSIDGRDIQKSIALGDGSESRELGREYNLTYRKDLLPNEKVTHGIWLSGKTHEVSVDKEFATRANIKLGSEIVFSIQGFSIATKITSLRESDSRAGLPFFYFVFNPVDLEKFPATFFGYMYVDEAGKNKLTSFLAQNFPNISIIDTFEITSLVQDLVGGLLVIIFTISIPPLALALFLIVTLIISSFAGRRKQSAQLLALGARTSFIVRLYYLETISTTIFSGILAYLAAIACTVVIATYYFKIKSVSLYNVELLIAFGFIVVCVMLLAFVIWRSDKRPLQELLAYEER